MIIGNRIGKKNPFPKGNFYDPEIASPNGKTKPFKTAKETVDHLSDVWISFDPIKIKDRMIYNHMAYTNVHDKFFARKHNVPQEEFCDYLKSWRSKSGVSTKKVDEILGYRHTAGHWFRKDNNSGSIPKPEDWWRLKKILGFDDKYDKGGNRA